MILKDKHILITGGARGLGRNFAECAIAEGAKVVISDLLEDLGRETADAIGATFVPVDLAIPGSIEACVAAAAKAMGGIDGLVNNGAITNSGGKTLDQLEIEIWDRVMTVNVRGTWLMTKAARPHLAKCGRGKVVNIASDTALWGAPKIMAYVASKGAVIAMTRGLARELGKDGITVNSLAPGFPPRIPLATIFRTFSAPRIERANSSGKFSLSRVSVRRRNKSSHSRPSFATRSSCSALRCLLPSRFVRNWSPASAAFLPILRSFTRPC